MDRLKKSPVMAANQIPGAHQDTLNQPQVCLDFFLYGNSLALKTINYELEVVFVDIWGCQ